MARFDQEDLAWFEAGVLVGSMLIEPEAWVRRRVETIEFLTQEETRRRVSVDFFLDEHQVNGLNTPEGVAVPLVALKKGRRKNFDMCDASGNAVPVLGAEANSYLTEIGLVSEAWEILDRDGLAVDEDERGEATQLLRRVVSADQREALMALSEIQTRGRTGGLFKQLMENSRFRGLAECLTENYVLFAITPHVQPGRQILKFGYADEELIWSDPGKGLSHTFAERLNRYLRRKLLQPDGRAFEVLLTTPTWGQSYHVEIVLPEELRAERAFLVNLDRREAILGAGFELDVNRISLHAGREILDDHDVDAYIELVPEQGQMIQALTFGIVTSATLGLGLINEVDIPDGDAAVAILLAGFAAFSVMNAVKGEHILVSRIFTGPRKAALAVGISAAAASISLAVDGTPHPLLIWWLAYFVAFAATMRIAWSVVRAASYPVEDPPRGRDDG